MIGLVLALCAWFMLTCLLPGDLHEQLDPPGPVLKFSFAEGNTTWRLSTYGHVVLATGTLDWPMFSWKALSLSAKLGADGNTTLIATAGGRRLTSVSAKLSAHARRPATLGHAINSAASLSEWEDLRLLPVQTATVEEAHLQTK